MLILYIRNLEEITLARKINKEQRKYDWQGLSQETKLICQELSIAVVNITSRNGRLTYKKKI